jgi:uncharacterized protein YabN with tetrapyrrole methylase and pyrophosphatase domain
MTAVCLDLAKEATPLPADLYLVGGGIYPQREITLEALEVIRRAKVYTILPSRGMKTFLECQGIAFEDISHVCVGGRKRAEIYRAIAGFVLERASESTPIAYVSYGHPMWLDDPAMLIVRGARERNISTCIVPGVSFVDMILARRSIAIGSTGVRVLTAARLVSDNIALDTRVPTFLAQIAALGLDEAPSPADIALDRIAPLIDRLLQFYPAGHLVTLCDSDEIGAGPVFVDLPLCTLPISIEGLSYATTLYVPPLASK